MSAPPAAAAVSFSVTPGFPSPISVGASNVPASLQIRNTSSFPNAGPQSFTNITLLPSCTLAGGLLNNGCTPDPDVYTLSATATGRSGTACANLTFNITAPDEDGRVKFVQPGDNPAAPTAAIALGAPGSTTDTCAIDFTISVVRPPSNGPTTSHVGTVQATPSSGGGTSSGTATSTVNTPPFVAIQPVRILDTRPDLGPDDGFDSPLAGDTTMTLPVAGKPGLPGSAASMSAVVLNVTVTGPTSPSFLTVWPSNAARPTASNLNFVKDQVVANAVVVGLGPDGAVKIFNNSGLVDVVVDVAGWFPAGRGYNPVTPSRILETRPCSTLPQPCTADADGFNTSLGPNGSIDIPVLNRGGIPGPPTNTNVGSVVVTVTAVEPSAAGFFTVWPTGRPFPTVSNLNFTQGLNVPNVAVVEVGNDGKISLFNSAGTTHAIIDVQGWFARDTSFMPVAPARILDTRPDLGPDDGFVGPVGAGQTINVPVVGRGGVPASGVGTVVLNVTTTESHASSFFTIWPTGGVFPPTSSLNFAENQTIANLVFAKVGVDGKVSLKNAFGSTHVIFDVAGWFPA